MKRLLSLLFVCVPATFLSFAQDSLIDYSFRLKNVNGFDRLNETVEIIVPSDLDLNTSTLMDENGTVVPFEITSEGKARFQANVPRTSTTGYKFTKGNRVSPQVLTYSAVKMPDSRADIAWENDLCAYRMYSTILLKNEPNTAQGVDVWQKKMNNPIIDNMYGLSNYHAESQYGMDVYSVNGKHLGCGGTAALVNGKLQMHDPYNSCEFIEQSSLKQIFKLTYNNVLIDGDYYKKTLTIESSANSLLNKATMRLEGVVKPVKIAVAIYDHKDMGITLDGNDFTSVTGLIGRAELKSEGSLTTNDARFYQGAYIPGNNVEYKLIDNHLCLVVDYVPGTDLVYYFGAGWNHFPEGRYNDDGDWFDALEKFKACIDNPLTVTSYKELPIKDDVMYILNSVNQTWQDLHPSHGDFFWNRAVYYIGNMHAYEVTGNQDYLNYSTAWAERNNWRGRDGSSDPTQWKWTYGESYNYVLFGDNQVCFQVYADLYNLDPQKDEKKIARALEVMGYEISTNEEGYLWWVDGLFMVMPVLSKLYKITGDQLYLDKMYLYWKWYTDRMFDETEDLYYRDANYVYPDHKTLSGKKDFWARGDGWIFAAFAKILQDVPENDVHRSEYISYYQRMAKALKKCQQDEGYWERSLIDPDQAPGYETSGTAFFAYGYAWGINNGLLSEEEYGETLEKAWNYLSNIAYQSDGTVGYIQPIGSQAIPGQILYPSSYYDFGVGAFLMAASEIYKFAADSQMKPKLRLTGATIGEANEIILTFNNPPLSSEAIDPSHYNSNVACDISNITVDGNKVIIEFEEPLDYGVYKIEVDGIHSEDGGELAAGQSRTIVMTVPLSAPQNGINVTAIGSQAGNPETNVIDNNLNTRWSCEGNNKWLLLDLGDMFTIEAVDIAFYNGNARVAYFNIQVSKDGKSFKNVLSNASSCGLTNELERFKITPIDARYVRIVCNGTSASAWNSITEVRVRTRDNTIDDIVLPSSIYSDILLPTQTDGGNTILWTSSDKNVLNGNGLVSLDTDDKPVKLTATGGSSNKSFDITVKARNPYANLQLLYSFDDTDVYVSDGQSYVKDKSLHMRDAKFMGSNGSVINGCLDLKGNNANDFSNNSYLIVPAHLLDSLRSFTIAFLATPISLSNQPRFYDFGINSGNSVFLRASQLSAGYKYNGGTTSLTGAYSQITTGKELKIAVTFDAKTHTTCIYVNGTKLSESTNITREPYELTRIALDERNYIGRTQWWDTSVSGDNIDYRGKLDEFHLFSMALNSEELNDLFSKMTTNIDVRDNNSPELTDNIIYDLTGRKVSVDKLSKGLYIINNKKVFIKGNYIPVVPAN